MKGQLVLEFSEEMAFEDVYIGERENYEIKEN
jgi:hypothetical protein